MLLTLLVQPLVMELQLQIKMNPKLYVRDPELSELGRNILKHSIEMIDALGFEEFTFKKLSIQVGTTEASIYRYFENKHRLLTYLITWYWTWLEYQMLFHTNNLTDSKRKIEIVISLLAFAETDKFILEHINKRKLHNILVSEGDKSYFTKHVEQDNEALLFKPFKDLCHRVAEVFLEYSPGYAYPHSLASTLVVTANHQLYFMQHLPRLTDFGTNGTQEQLIQYLQSFVFRSLA